MSGRLSALKRRTPCHRTACGAIRSAELVRSIGADASCGTRNALCDVHARLSVAACGSDPAIANAIYNATGVRVRDYPVTLDRLITEMAKTA